MHKTKMHFYIMYEYTQFRILYLGYFLMDNFKSQAMHNDNA